ncbi:MAG: hypothetical protein R3C68_12995 [Myxococcota bacterium]
MSASILLMQALRATNRARSLVESLNKKGGRNNGGRISVRFRGGGHKRRYRKIDFRRNKLDVPAKVASGWRQ